MNDQVRILDQHGHPIRASETAHFAASRRARELRNWQPANVSADAALLDEGDTIASRAYDLERNNGVVSGAIRTHTDNIVGSGLRLAAKPDYRALGRTKEWADEWAKKVEALWRTFADTPEFDAARQLTFGGMTAMQLRTSMLSGEALALALWLTEQDRTGARWRTCLQAIDPARLATPSGKTDGQRLRGGIEINGFGEPQAYWIRKSHPIEVGSWFGTPEEFERVAARTSFGRRKVIHLYEKQRPGQSRGRSVLAAVMGSLRMLDHYQRIELQTAVVNSMIAAFVETPLNGEQIVQMFGEKQEFLESRNNWNVKLDGAAIIPLHPGDKLNPFTPNRPSTAFSAFVEAVLRTVGTGINMPYELLMRDFSKTTYSSARAALAEAWRYFMAQREWLSSYWCDPVYELWLEEAISRGDIDAPDFYENRAAYCRCKWIGPGRGYIDPLKEAQAQKVRLEAGISTLERESSEQGEDWEEVLEQRSRENEKARELGLPDVHIPPAQGGSPDQAKNGNADPAGDDNDDEQPAGTPARGGNQ